MARAHQPWCISTLLVQVLPWTQVIRSHPGRSVSSTNDGLRKFVYMKRRKTGIFDLIVYMCSYRGACLLLLLCRTLMNCSSLLECSLLWLSHGLAALSTHPSYWADWGVLSDADVVFLSYFILRQKIYVDIFSVALQRIFSAHLLHCCCVDPILYF